MTEFRAFKQDGVNFRITLIREDSLTTRLVMAAVNDDDDVVSYKEVWTQFDPEREINDFTDKVVADNTPHDYLVLIRSGGELPFWSGGVSEVIGNAIKTLYGRPVVVDIGNASPQVFGYYQRVVNGTADEEDE